MIIEWSYEIIIATVVVILSFTASAFWTREFKKIGFLLLGFVGLWLAIVQPFYLHERSLETAEVDDIQGFLASEQMQWTDTVNLVGGGYKLEDIDLLKEYYIKQKDFEIPIGFADIRIPKVIEGELFIIQGKYESKNDSLNEIWLESPSGEQVQVEVDEYNKFSAELKAPVKGLYEYEIMLVANGDTLQEVVPIQVEASSKVNMLIMASNPQFELNYLKNYWVSLGHSMVQKVRISKEKYSTNFVNIPKFTFTSLTSNVLDRFDIVLMDMVTWNSVSSRERNLILKAVREQGLGLALKPTKIGESAKGLPYHKVLKFVESEIESVSVELAEIEKNSVWKAMDYGHAWKSGFGTIIILEISDSYKLILHDKAQKYNQIWAEILSELFVRKNEGFTLSTPFLTYENESVSSHIGFINQDDELVFNDSISLIINYTPFLDGDGEAKVVGHRGWNKVSKTGTVEAQWFYAFEKGSWETKRATQVKKYINKLQLNRREGKVKPYMEHEEIPWWISILGMIFGFGAVWLMEKLG